MEDNASIRELSATFIPYPERQNYPYEIVDSNLNPLDNLKIRHFEQYIELLKNKYKEDVERQTLERKIDVLVCEALAVGAETYVTHNLLSEPPITNNQKLFDQLKAHRSDPFLLGHILHHNDHLIAFSRTFRPLQITMGVDNALRFLINVDLDKCNDIVSSQYNSYLAHPETLPQLPPRS